MLVPLLHNEPSALLITELKCCHGGGCGRLLSRRFNRAEILPALSNDRHAPTSQLGTGELTPLGSVCGLHLLVKLAKLLYRVPFEMALSASITFLPPTNAPDTATAIALAPTSEHTPTQDMKMAASKALLQTFG
jgi:hypothetical protein